MLPPTRDAWISNFTGSDLGFCAGCSIHDRADCGSAIIKVEMNLRANCFNLRYLMCV